MATPVVRTALVALCGSNISLVLGLRGVGEGSSELAPDVSPPAQVLRRLRGRGRFAVVSRAGDAVVYLAAGSAFGEGSSELEPRRWSSCFGASAPGWCERLSRRSRDRRRLAGLTSGCNRLVRVQLRTHAVGRFRRCSGGRRELFAGAAERTIRCWEQFEWSGDLRARSGLFVSSLRTANRATGRLRLRG